MIDRLEAIQRRELGATVTHKASLTHELKIDENKKVYFLYDGNVMIIGENLNNRKIILRDGE